MSIIQATLSSVRDWLIFKMRDNSSYDRIPKTIYDSAINLAVGEIAKDTSYYERTVGVKTDGTRLFHTLRGSNPEDVGADYLSMMTVMVDGEEIPLAANRDMYRDSVRFPSVNRREWSALYTNNGYSIRNEKLNFGIAVPASTEMIIDDEDRNFTTTKGHWVEAGGVLTWVAGELLYTRNAAPNAMTITLPTARMTALVVGNYYVLSFYAKYETKWDGGAVTVTMGNYSTTFTPTTSWQRVTLRFQADATTSDIVLYDDSIALTGANLLYLDTFTLSDCVLVVTYHGIPDALVADADSPPSPLNLHQLLLMNKAIECLSQLSPVDVTVLRDAVALTDKYMEAFVKDTKLKGDGQSRTSHSNR